MIEAIQGDVAEVEVDAVVNAAELSFPGARGHGGTIVEERRADPSGLAMQVGHEEYRLTLVRVCPSGPRRGDRKSRFRQTADANGLVLV